MEYLLAALGVGTFLYFTLMDQKQNYLDFVNDNRRINTQTTNLVVK
jgi:hypothetical protein